MNPALPWAAPVIHWRSREEATGQYGRVLAEGEYLDSWAPTPFEKSPTDCFRLGGDFWLWQEGVGGVQFHTDRPELFAFPDPQIDSTRFEALITRSWLPALYQVWGRQVLHASAVAADDGSVVVFAGPTQAGKSTFAFGLGRRDGWTQIGDDMLAFSCDRDAIFLHPLRTESRLRPASADYFRCESQPAGAISWPERALRPERIYFLSQEEELDTPAISTPLTQADSYRRLLEQAVSITLKVPHYNQRLMLDYLTLARTSTWRLSYRRSFAAMEAALDAIERNST